MYSPPKIGGLGGRSSTFARGTTIKAIAIPQMSSRGEFMEGGNKFFEAKLTKNKLSSHSRSAYASL
jgi:hypothetical protein